MQKRYEWMGDVWVLIPPPPPPKAQRRRRHRCEGCGGKGRVSGMVKIRGMGKGAGSAFGPCPDCDGVGWITDDP